MCECLFDTSSHIVKDGLTLIFQCSHIRSTCELMQSYETDTVFRGIAS